MTITREEAIEELATIMKAQGEPTTPEQHIADELHLMKTAGIIEVTAQRDAARKEEREACAKVADEHRDPPSTEYGEGWDASASSIAAAIRARSSTPETDGTDGRGR